MGPSFWQIFIILLIILIIFGAGKLPKVMGDLGKGLKAFKHGMHDEDPSSKLQKDSDGSEEKLLTHTSTENEETHPQEDKKHASEHASKLEDPQAPALVRAITTAENNPKEKTKATTEIIDP